MNDKIVITAEADELTIEPKNGKVIDLENSDLSVGKIVFKKKEKELPTKWEDLDNSIIKSYLCRDFPTIEEIEANKALRKLCYLRDAYNGEPLANWCDCEDDNTKYCIYFYEEKICKTRNRGDRKVLSFKTAELRDKFSKNFEKLILTAKPLL